MQTPTATNSIVSKLSSLSDSTRLRVLRLLEREELSVGELVQILQLPQSTVSRHLKTLMQVDWIAKRSSGSAGLYRLVLDDLDAASRALWLEVRSQLDTANTDPEDFSRLRSVLAERRTDSRSYFGRVAGEWDDVRRELFGDRFTAAAALSLIPSDWTVADLGCGTGDAAELIAPWAGRVVAVDTAPEMLQAGRKRLDRVQNVEFVEAELEKLPLEPATVDAVTIFLVLHHLPEPVRALREAARVLRRDRGGGIAVIVDMIAHERDSYRQEMGHKHLGFSDDEINEMFRAAGFERPRVRRLEPAADAKGPPLFAASARVRDEPR